MKSKPTTGVKTPVEIKHLTSFFVKPGLQVLRDELSMDWSKDTPKVQSSPISHASSAEENMSSSHALLYNCYKMRVWTDFGLGLGLGP